MSQNARTYTRRIFLVRHGAVDYAAQASLSKHTQISLTETGQEQARCLARHVQDISFDRVFSSPLDRCVETASIVSGQTPSSFTLVPDLREVEPGSFDGLSRTEIAGACQGAFSNPTDTSPFLGGETFGSLRQRVQRGWDAVCQDQSWQTGLLVAHEVVNRALLSLALRTDVSVFEQLEQEECCLNILDLAPDGHVILRLMNFAAHDPLTRTHSTRSMDRLAAALLD